MKETKQRSINNKVGHKKRPGIPENIIGANLI